MSLDPVQTRPLFKRTLILKFYFCQISIMFLNLMNLRGIKYQLFTLIYILPTNRSYLNFQMLSNYYCCGGIEFEQIEGTKNQFKENHFLALSV